MTAIVTEPGLYEIPELDYHADRLLAPELGRSLSVSGAKTILTAPARFAYERANGGRPPKDTYDLGTIAHELILRGGDKRLRIFDAYDWRGKADQAGKKAAHAEGLVPIHRGDLLEASKMARAVRRHPVASAILSEGKPEQAFYWIDEATGVTCRGRVDWLRDNAIVDLKTCADASPAGFAKAAASYGYDQQADFYTTGIEAVTGQRLPFIFIAVEKTPPFLIGIYQLDEAALDRGARRNREALNTYAHCESTGEWPGYSTDIEPLSLPRWAN